MIKMTAGIYLTIMITTIVVIGVAACIISYREFKKNPDFYIQKMKEEDPEGFERLKYKAEKKRRKKNDC